MTSMVRDLDMPIRIDVSPIVREADGLALSSRNRYLTADERSSALSLNRALRAIVSQFSSGERGAHALEQVGLDEIARDAGVRLDYLAPLSTRAFNRPELADASRARRSSRRGSALPGSSITCRLGPMMKT